MTPILVPFGLGLVLAIGCFVFARVLDPEGEGSLGRILKIAGIAVFLGGSARAGWVAFRGVELPDVPDVAAMSADLVDGLSPGAIRTECLAGDGAFVAPATRAAECECTVRAVEHVRQTEPTFSVRVRDTLQLDGTETGLAAFRQSYGECAAPQLRNWIATDCRSGCAGDPAACTRGCNCVADEILRGRSPSAIGTIFWPERTAPGESADYTMHNLVVRAAFQCQMQ